MSDQQADTQDKCAEIYGPFFRGLLDRMEGYADRDASVLVWGPTGTGKELLLRAYVDRKKRSGTKGTILNCAAVAPTLLDSELFGHVKGAFTGAISTKKGLIEKYDCLALDELMEAPTDFQSRLLRVMEHGEYQAVGAAEVRSTRKAVRIVAAAGDPALLGLRRDLIWRFEERVRIPRLQYRRLDLIEMLAGFGREQIAGFTERCLRFLLEDWSWPGNAREVRYVLAFAGRQAKGKPVDLAHLPMSVSGEPLQGQRDVWELDDKFVETATKKFPALPEFEKYAEESEMRTYYDLSIALLPMSDYEVRKEMLRGVISIARVLENMEKQLGRSFDEVAAGTLTPREAEKAAERAWYAARLTEGRSQAEIARRVGMSPQAVGQALRRLALVPARAPLKQG